MDRIDQEKVCEVLRNGGSLALAAVEVGMRPGNLQAAIEEDPSFSAEVNAAMEACIGDVEFAVAQKAKAGNLGAAKFFLTNRAPDRWAERTTVRHEGTVETRVNVEVSRAIVGALERGGADSIIDIVDALEVAEYGEVAGELPPGP